MKGASSNDSAFPTTKEATEGYAAEGMSMRQYYKAAALPAILSSGETMHAVGILAKSRQKPVADVVAAACGEYADAMLAEDEEHGKK